MAYELFSQSRGSIPYVPYTAYTLVITGQSANPSLGASAAFFSYFRQVGDQLDIHYGLNQSSAGVSGAGIYLYSLPTGYSINLAAVRAANTAIAGSSTIGGGLTPVGYGQCSNTDVPAAQFAANSSVFVWDATHVMIMANFGVVAEIACVGSANFPLSSNPIFHGFFARVPILV